MALDREGPSFLKFLVGMGENAERVALWQPAKIPAQKSFTTQVNVEPRAFCLS